MDNKDINTYIKSMFDFVRVIDPISNKILEDNYTESKNKCYKLWSCKDICKNCVGARAYNNEGKSFVKIEYNNDSVYLVMAKAISHNDNKYILECVKDVTKSDILDDISKMTNEQIQEEVERMNMLVALDVLTECYNRRYINEELPIEIARAKKYKKNLSVMMMDIDYFKDINDKYGHLAGDYVLKKIVKIVKNNIRSLSDWIARYGGEEFIIILNNTDSSKAFLLAERIRLAIENTTFNYKVEKIKVTVSIGVTTLSDNINNKNKLIERADKNLYKAKSMGRNICILDGESLTCK
ncbi:MAG: GGDEF domain-containing protein [Clostridium perfringens]|nr:GGDEF domain-containing protein [Clostridium perfringens]